MGRHTFLFGPFPLCAAGLLAFGAGAADAAEPGTPAKDPITDEMRQALARVNRAHAGMDQKDIDDAVEALHHAIGRADPKVFVPLAVGHLLRLAPRDTQTRILLRRALANGWLEEELARAYLVRAGDTPGPHLTALVRALDSADPKARRRAVGALGDTGAAGAAALPALRAIVANAKADPSDYNRAYTLASPMPLHVAAHHAILRIEAELRDRTP